MTEQEINNEYPVLEHKSMRLTKASILMLSGKDEGKDLTDDRCYIIDYCDTKSDANGDKFFYEMLGCVKFILEDCTAYTTPDKIICLNYPCTDIIPQDKDRFQRWYYVYCHECLHQLWDTFSVGDEIEKEKGECDRQLLNIASDCVINDFLSNINDYGKKEPIQGITPKYIQEAYGVTYDRNKDTQYSLYLKLAELPDAKKKEMKKKHGDQPGGDPGQGGESGQGEQQSKGGQQGKGGQQSSKPNSTPSKAAKDASDAAQKAANAARDAADQVKESGDKQATDEANSAANRAQEAADQAKRAANKAKECEKKGDKEGATNALKEVAEQTKKAAEAAKEAKDILRRFKKDDDSSSKKDGSESSDKSKDGKEGDSKDSQQSSKDDSKGDENLSDLDKAIKDAENAAKQAEATSGDGKGQEGQAGEGDGDLINREMIDEVKERATKICKKYADSISGSLGEFVEKCKISKKLNPNGLAMDSRNGSNNWNKKLDTVCKQYIHQKLISKKLYKNTYNRMRRGERAYTSADMRNHRIIVQGREEIKQQIGFDINLYVDVSGSMGSVIDKVFDAAYDICRDLKEKFGHDKNVDKDKINLKSYVFTDIMKEIKFGQKCTARGGTYSFDNLIEDILKRGDMAFLNIIITDGDFNGINDAKISKLLKDTEGLFVLVNNKGEGYFKSLEDKVKSDCGTKLVVIYADHNFTLSK